MPINDNIAIENIFQNLSNPRNISQADDTAAIMAILSANPDWFYELTESLIDTGYLPVENLVLIKIGKNKYTVHEGNRRAGILKILHGIYDQKKFDFPEALRDKIKTLDKQWKTANAKIPSVIYEPTDKATVDKIVRLVHGKGEKAGRLPWNSVERAREARDNTGKMQLGLDLLEKYLKSGKNINQQQRERWSGDFPLTVLDELLPKLPDPLKLASASEIVKKYPAVMKRKELEEILHDIGTSVVGFKEIRKDLQALLISYGIAIPAGGAGSGGGSGGASGSGGKGTGTGSGSGSGTGAGGTGKGGKATVYASNDPKVITQKLKGFKPKGRDREKVVLLRDEALRLNIEKTPISFCFVLRSMFEISAKAYCNDHGIDLQTTKMKGLIQIKSDKSLKTLLSEIAKDLIKKSSDATVQKQLHGANAELSKTDGMLSVTSLNQLVHNTTFSVRGKDIAGLFSNVFPLLEKMN